MFLSFFYFLRTKGFKISASELISLANAMNKGICGTSLSNFYYVSRGIFVKNEKDYDRFDSAFLEFFKGVSKPVTLPDKLLAWLDKEKPQKDFSDFAKDLEISQDDVRNQFLDRLLTQDSEHNCGSNWIGTDGSSLFGNDGSIPQGLRAGGETGYGRAFEIAGQRRFRDFRDDKVLDVRNFQIALRSLRQLSANDDFTAAEFDLDATIHQTGQNGGLLKIAYKKPRKNALKLLLLMDSGGSMDIYQSLCTSLFKAVNSATHFKDLKIYYFHNCIKGYLYPTPELRYDDRIETKLALKKINGDYKTIIVGDAMMDPHELNDLYYYDKTRKISALDWLYILAGQFPSIVWMTPQDLDFWRDKPWGGRSIKTIGEFITMYKLTPQGLESACKMLRQSRKRQ